MPTAVVVLKPDDLNRNRAAPNLILTRWLVQLPGVPAERASDCDFLVGPYDYARAGRLLGGAQLTEGRLSGPDHSSSWRSPTAPASTSRAWSRPVLALASSSSEALHAVTHAWSKSMDLAGPDLGNLELEVMQLVWAAGDITADQVRERLSRQLKESTVRTVLRRLEVKGYVTHTVDGRTYVFKAASARQDVAARAVKRIVGWFCNGSVEEVLVGMADARMLDPETLKLLAQRIEAAKGGR